MTTIRLQWGTMDGQLTPEEAKALARQLFGAAGAAERIAADLGYGRVVLEMDAAAGIFTLEVGDAEEALRKLQDQSGG